MRSRRSPTRSRRACPPLARHRAQRRPVPGGRHPLRARPAIADALPAENSAALWWRLVAVWQGLLLGGAVAGLAWCWC